MNSGSPDKEVDASMGVAEIDGGIPAVGKWSAALDLNLAAGKDEEGCGHENDVPNGRMEMDLNQQQLHGEVNSLPLVNGNYIYEMVKVVQLERSNIPGEDGIAGDCIGRDRDMEAADDFERRCCSSPTKIASLPTEKLDDEIDVHGKQNSGISDGETGNDFYNYAGKSSDEIRSKDRDDEDGDLSDAVYKNDPVDRLDKEDNQMEYVAGDMQKYESYSSSNLDAQPNTKDMQGSNAHHFPQERVLGSVSPATETADSCRQSPHRFPSAGMEPNSLVNGSHVSPLSENQEVPVPQCETPHSSSLKGSPSRMQSPKGHSKQKGTTSQDNIQQDFPPRKSARTDKGSLSPQRFQQQDSPKQEGSSKGCQSASPKRRHSSPGRHRRHDRSLSRSPSRRREQKDASSGSRRDYRYRSRSRSPHAREHSRRSPRRRYSPMRRSPPSAYHSHRRSPRRRPWSPPPNRSTGVGKPGNSLFVAGFSFATTERDLERKFSRFGRVTDVRIVRERRPTLWANLETGGESLLNIPSRPDSSNSSEGVN
ncbi:hypothetical protein EJ110_NYTH01053 [Nymphaea thermarum]|nr:hypothetical protein EJ110_NYTH01053 [Nymphaea thermarum]